MRIKKLRVRNFRLIEELSVDLDQQTALLGGNGCGKSTVLRAMDKFFGQQSNLEADDYFGRDLTRSVEIELTFQDFSDSERQLFASRIHRDQMSVTRVFDPTGGRGNGRYFGSAMRHSAFEPARSLEGARERTAAYNQVRASEPKYASLPSIRAADQIPAALDAWELEHQDECVLSRDDGQFFGFTNVAKGALQRATSFVFVPAVRDASLDSLDAKGAVIARLMELVVRSAIQQRQDIREFQERITREFRDVTNPERLPELGGLEDALTRTLQVFYRDAGVGLEWRPVDDFVIPLPAAEVSLDDDGFRGPVDRKGHGLQRAFILTLLQHLSRASAEAASTPAVDSADDAPPQGLTEAPGLILAIEEPELYQHPTKQRHFARVLSELSAGRIPGVAGSTQVIFASHSSLFVSMDRFDEIRIARRVAATAAGIRCCELREAQLSKVVSRLEAAQGITPGTFSEEALRARLHILGPELAEGFFANLVVLVEGVSDRAALMAVAQSMSFSLEAYGIAVLPVGGKSNLDRPAVIFAELGIPVYLIWDCDSSKTDATERANAISQNKALQRISGVDEASLVDFQTVVRPGFASFDDCLERVLVDEIGRETFDKYLAAVKTRFGVLKNREALKIPAVVADILARAATEGRSSQTLIGVVGAIQSLVRSD